jgi:dienelactone hydrolase
VTDHPVLIPSSEGPVGGIVSEPAGKGRAGMMLLAGYGRPARSGTNAFWTRTARGLAERGVTTLRIDYSQEGENHLLGEVGEGLNRTIRRDLGLVDQAATWFSTKLDALPLFMGGVCGGARLSIELAAREPELSAGVFLVVPELSAITRPHGVGGPLPEEPEALDPWTIECLRDILGRTPCWALVGELDDGHTAELPRLLGSTPHPCELETVPGLALHFLDHPDIQEQVQDRLTARVVRALAEREAVEPSNGTPSA